MTQIHEPLHVARVFVVICTTIDYMTQSMNQVMHIIHLELSYSELDCMHMIFHHRCLLRRLGTQMQISILYLLCTAKK